MDFTRLGTSGLRVSRMGLGTMTFGTEWQWGTDEAGAKAIFDAYTEAGGNFLDTANFYTGGTAERILGHLIEGDRDRFVVATKYTMGMPPNDPNAAGNHRKNLRRALRDSLDRLGTDHVDILWMHAWDGVTPVEEVLRAANEAMVQGQILHFGVSDTPAWVVARMVEVAHRLGLSGPVAAQFPYSLAERTVERELLPMVKALGLTACTWAPLAGGALSGKYGRTEHGASESRRLDVLGTPPDDRAATIAQIVGAVAEQEDRAPVQVALAWLLARGPEVVPLLGARSVSQLEESLRSLDVRLSPEALQQLDAASGIEPEFPVDFLSTYQELVWGGTHDRFVPRE